MKQKKLKLACVALLSALVLNTGAAFADEVVANDNTSDTAIVDTASSNSNPTNVVSPTTPVDTNSNSNDVPIVERTKELISSDKPLTNSTDTPVTDSSEKPSTDATQPSKEAPVTEPSKDTASSEKPSTDATQPSKEAPVEKAFKDLVKPSTDATKPSTEAPVVDPSVSPVITDSGLKIVGVENSNPVVANPDGSTTVVAPESIGAKVNPDKTLSVKTDSGKMVTLPVTGTEEVISLIASLIGMVTMAATVVLRKKMLKDN